MPSRIYAVHAHKNTEFHLVEAANKSAALRHVASRVYGVAVADQKTLVAAIKDGVPIELAGEESPEPVTVEEEVEA